MRLRPPGRRARRRVAGARDGAPDQAIPTPSSGSTSPPPADERPPSELRAGMRGADLSVHVASDLLGGLLVWMGAGWLLDRWLATDPWFTVIGALVGYAGGLYLVWRRVRHLDETQTEVAAREHGTRP